MSSPEQPSPPSSAWIELPGKQTLPLDRDCYFGRTEGNEIIIPDTRVSRRHAVVRAEGRRFVLVDLGSTNGTWLNQTRIFKPVVLNDGDEIVVGDRCHTFCQPVVAAETPEDLIGSTSVVVAKTPCWMLLASVSEARGPGSAWLDEIRQTLSRGGAGVRALAPASLFAHWRMDRTASSVVRAAVQEVAGRDRPPGARLALHLGPVRVGGGTNPGEENLLGAEVSFAHRLPGAAAELGVSFVLSEPAVQSLTLDPPPRSLGAHAVRDTSGARELFAL